MKLRGFTDSLRCLSWLTLLMPARRIVFVVVDSMLILLTGLFLVLSDLLTYQDFFTLSLVLFFALRVTVFVSTCMGFGLYRIISTDGVAEGTTIILKAVVAYIIVFSPLWFYELFTFSWLLLDGVLIGFSMIGMRILVANSFAKDRGQSESGIKTLIYGAGQAGRQLGVALKSSRHNVLCGFVDDNRNLQGHEILGKPIISIGQLSKFVKANRIEELLLAIPSLSISRKAEILSKVVDLPLRVRTLPALREIVDGKVNVSDITGIEIADLLGRSTISPDDQLLSAQVEDEVVMVTGAGGSIGGELCRQIIKCKPRVLILFEVSEYALYNIHQALSSYSDEFTGTVDEPRGNTRLIPILADVKDERIVDMVLEKWRPHIIYHAAASKHVPIVENNVGFAIQNNIFAMITLTQAAVRREIPNFLLISSDKAVNPTNIMGATKRVCEQILHSLGALHNQRLTGIDSPINNALGDSGIRYSAVRFGNVLGSSGSVVPKFREQIEKRQPVTLTHKKIERYFMTVEEASQLVLQASALMAPNEAEGEVFILDMGSPVRIYDLARQMISLSGLSQKTAKNPDGDIEIRFTGLRPGEKMFEELCHGGETVSTQHPRISKVQARFLPWSELDKKISKLRDAVEENDIGLIHEILGSMVEGYSTDGIISDLFH